MSWDESWENIFQNKVYGRYPHDVFVSFMAQNFYNTPDRKSVKVLEIGCGSGNNLWYLCREGFSAYGLDGSRTAIGQSKRYLSENNVDADLKVGEAGNLDYEDSFFDLVLDFGCIGCNEEEGAKEILAEVKRVLKPKGLYFNECVAEGCDMGEYQNMEGNTFFDLSNGPFSGIGVIRAVSYDDIDKLYGQFLKIRSVDYMNRSINNGQYNMKKYIIVAEKPDAT